MAVKSSAIALSFLTALLGELTDDLWGVALSRSENEVLIVMYYGVEINEKIEERVDCMETEMLADFFPELRVKCKPVRVSNKEEMDPLDFWILLRRLEE